MAKAPKRQKKDGLYGNKSYSQRDGYASKELRILNNSSETGYAVNIPGVTADNDKSWNGALIAPFGAYIKLWITEVQMDFSVTGTVGQSRYRRQFFPKAFNQPKVMVKGVMPNQKEYNRLAAFIRETHFEAVTGNIDLYSAKARQSSKNKVRSSASLQTISLIIKDAGQVNKQNPLRSVKGGHKAMQMDGYIKSISAGATQFNFAPEFNFQFVPASSKLTGSIGIYEDTLDAGSELSSWMDMFSKNAIDVNNFNSNQSTNSKPVK